MLFTFLAWPVLSVALATAQYHHQTQDSSLYRPTNNPDNLIDMRTVDVVEKNAVFVRCLIGASVLTFVFTAFCLSVEGLLLFAMKDDK